MKSILFKIVNFRLNYVMNSIHHTILGKSAAGNPIEIFKKTNTSSVKKPFLFIGGVHGDEPEGVEMAQKLLQWLTEAEKSQSLRSWILIPCINPDGYKNNQRTNGNGVDLNRNFPSKDWTSENSRGARYSPGSHAGSEPEVAVLVQVIEQEKPEVIFHFHSWEPCVVYTGAPGKTYAEFLSPNESYPVREDIGYPTPGSLGQYGWQNHKIPVICIEEQEKIDLKEVWPHFRDGFKNLMLHYGP
jgi:protein MpaA